LKNSHQLTANTARCIIQKMGNITETLQGLGLPKEVIEAAEDAQAARDGMEAGKVLAQANDYFQNEAPLKSTAPTRTFSTPLRISEARAAQLFSADRNKQKSNQS